MITQSITYTNYNGDEHTETAAFNLNEQDILDIEAAFPGGIEKVINDWQETNDGREMIKLFKMIIAKAYGVKSEDGMYFNKTEEQSARFMNSAAYEQLFRELITDEDLATTFFNSLVRLPKDVQRPNVKRS